MKKIITLMITTLTLAISSVSASAYYNTDNLPTAMTFSDAIDIFSENEILGGRIININEEKSAEVSMQQARDVFSQLKNIELKRTMVKTPFSGLVFVFETTDSLMGYYLNSGVQIGKYGSDNYICYIPDSANSCASVIQSIYFSSESYNTELAFPINDSNDFLKAPKEDWAVSFINKAASDGLLPYDITSHYNKNITREEFCILIANMMSVYKNYKNISDYMRDSKTVYQKNYFKDCLNTDISVDILHTLGIVDGKEDNLFMPDAFVTRQEAAKIISKTAEQFGPLYTDAKLSFSDTNKISSWALFYVQWCSQHNIMMGNENHEFAPDTNFTVTEAIVTVCRLYDYLQNT